MNKHQLDTPHRTLRAAAYNQRVDVAADAMLPSCLFGLAAHDAWLCNPREQSGVVTMVLVTRPWRSASIDQPININKHRPQCDDDGLTFENSTGLRHSAIQRAFLEGCLLLSRPVT